MAYLADKKETQAKSELQEMILMDPKRGQTNPSEKYYSPQIRQLYRQVLSEMQSAEKGDLHIQTTPANATVFLDGVAQGVTPFDIQDIPAGKHHIRLVPAGTTQGEMISSRLSKVKTKSNIHSLKCPLAITMHFFRRLVHRKNWINSRILSRRNGSCFGSRPLCFPHTFAR